MSLQSEHVRGGQDLVQRAHPGRRQPDHHRVRPQDPCPERIRISRWSSGVNSTYQFTNGSCSEKLDHVLPMRLIRSSFKVLLP